jgi:hypothetical protein
MCENCVEIDKKIANYQRLTFRFTDQAMLDGTKVLIERATGQKAELHPEERSRAAHFAASFISRARPSRGRRTVYLPSFSIFFFSSSFISLTFGSWSVAPVV